MFKKISTIVSILVAALFTITFQVYALSGAKVDEPPFPDQRTAVKQAVYWMVREFQNDDGGYASFSAGANQAPSSVAGTLDAIVSLAASGYNPAAVFPGESAAPFDYLAAHAADVIAFATANGGQAGKVILALTASSIEPRDYLGFDFVAELTGDLEPTGSYSVSDPFKQSLAMLGVAAAGDPIPASAIAWLVERQATNGSWDDGFGTTDSADATAMAVMALIASGRGPSDPSLSIAIEFFSATQQTRGWEYGPGLGTSANSTALVIQALSALGEDWYSSSGPWGDGGETPLLSLLSYQSVTGAFQSDFGQGPFDDFYATVQAIPAVSGKPYPLPARLEAARKALSCLDALQDSATGGWPAFAGGLIDASGTSRAIQAIVAAGENPRSPRWTTAGGVDAVEALEALTPAYLAGGRGGRVGIVMQGVVAAGPPQNASDFAGENLPLLASSYLSSTGEYDSTAFGIFAHAETMLGLLSAGEPIAPPAMAFLLDADTDGNWGDSDSNGIVMQVLGLASKATPAGTIQALHASQSADGGWGFDGAASPSTSSEVIQGLVSVGLNPFSPDWSRIVDGRITSAADAIMAQQGDNGCWPNAFGSGDDPYSTTDVILLLTRRPGWGFSQVRLPYTSADR